MHSGLACLAIYRRLSIACPIMGIYPGCDTHTEVRVRRGVEMLVRAVPHGLREDILHRVRWVPAATSCLSALSVLTGPRTC